MTEGSTTQLSMFSDEHNTVQQTQNLLAGISWSYSRRETLYRCVRLYYYEYFGSSKLTAEHEPLKEHLRFLKALQNRHERIGKILHTAISTYLRKSRGGTVWDDDRFIGWGASIFQKDIEFSRAYQDKEVSNAGEFPPSLLREFYYHNPHAEELCQQAAERLTGALQSFCDETRFQSFRVEGRKPKAEIEKHFSKLGGFPFDVEGVVDLAFPTWTGASVVDWKTGEDDGSGDNSLQMAVYGLWAAEYFGSDPDTLRICKAHLSSREVVDFRSDANVLAAARARIIQDALTMQTVEEYGNRGIVDAFSPCLRQSICRQCSYLEICPEGRALIHD